VPRLGDKAVLLVLMKMNQRTVRKAVFMHILPGKVGLVVENSATACTLRYDHRRTIAVGNRGVESELTTNGIKRISESTIIAWMESGIGDQLNHGHIRFHYDRMDGYS
jgi:hypothetical protein